jgi:hypothetical protein
MANHLNLKSQTGVLRKPANGRFTAFHLRKTLLIELDDQEAALAVTGEFYLSLGV